MQLISSHCYLMKIICASTHSRMQICSGFPASESLQRMVGVSIAKLVIISLLGESSRLLDEFQPWLA